MKRGSIDSLGAQGGALPAMREKNELSERRKAALDENHNVFKNTTVSLYQHKMNLKRLQYQTAILE